MLSRREFVLGVSTVAATGLIGRQATASMSIALTLGELVKSSSAAVLATPVNAYSAWEKIGGRRRIVTYSELQVEQSLDDRPLESPELTVRTLGGRVGDIGQIVHGEAALHPGDPAGIFLTTVASGLYAVTGMAQGHYLLRQDDRGESRLRRSPNMRELLQAKDNAAVVRLDGRTVREAIQLILSERRQNAK